MENMAKYWKEIVDLIHDGIMVVDPRGNIMAANAAAEKLTGYSAGELIGKSCRILNCTGCKIRGEGYGEKWCELFSVGNVRDKKCLITNKDRRTVHILKSASVLQDEAGKTIGAVETLTDMSEVVRKQREITSLRRACHLYDGYYGILGKSPVMRDLFEVVDNVAGTDAPVLIYGESGSGKELVARAVHEAGPRKDNPYIKVNCAALNENILESELFGHVKGAYTGAGQDRAGRFEAAHEGTIFLDEIGDIPLSTQVKLLRALEEKKIERVGDNAPVNVDVRIISATNKDIDRLIASGEFREDFYFRINVFPIRCPALRERRDDIPVIAQHFIMENASKTGKKILGVTPEAMEIFSRYPWPGNVRELRNAVEYAFVLCQDGAIDVRHLPPRMLRPTGGGGDSPASVSDAAADAERRALLAALRQAGGNQSEAARILNVSRVTVWKRMKKHGVDLQKEGVR